MWAGGPHVLRGVWAVAETTCLFLALVSVGEATAPLRLFVRHPVRLCVHPFSHPPVHSFPSL